MNQQQTQIQDLAERVFHCVKGDLIIRREIIRGNEHIFYCPLEEKVCKYQEEKFNLKREEFYYKCIHYKE